MGNLTNSQKSIWVTEQYYKGSSVNNICGFAIIEEQIDLEKLKRAIQIVCQKHDNFWLQLKIEEGEVKQFLSERKEIKIDTINVANPEELEEKIQEIVKIPFKLEESELFKFYIYKFENGQGGYMPKVHHLIGDGWTMALISNEIIKTYSQLKQNQDTDEMPIYSYIDYMKSEKEYLESEKYQKDKKYWEDKFTQIPEVATIPGSKINGNESNPEGNREKYKLDSILVENIKKYCKENKISLYNFFMAIYAIYIGEITNLDEFVIGTPILNRTNFKEKSAMGMFINMVPFKINMNQNDDFQAFVKNIAIESMGMLKHQKYSYQSLLENLREKNKNIPSLYNILLSYQITNTHQNGGDMIYKNDWAFNGCCAENMDIQISDFNDTGSLDISYDYKTSIYEQKDIENLHKRILYIIQQVISKEEIELKDIEIVTPEEKDKLVNEFNRTELEYDIDETVISLFEKQVEKTPEKIAIICNNKKLTYKELNEKANMLSREMIKKGVNQQDIIGIMLNRSPEMIIGLIAILKCGATYLPIDPEYPPERILYMLENSETRLVLVNDNTQELVPENCSKININYIENISNENLNLNIDGDTLVYLIYTSGSTGKPKGVQITNRNLNNFIKGMKKEIDFNENKIMVSVTTICFDIFGLEMWCSLTSGLTLVVANELEQNMPTLLNKLCLENKVNMIQTTPSRYSIIFENTENLQFLENITDILVGGEALNEKILANMKKYSKAKIFNVYGPTETTIWSTIKELTKENEITVGKPIANTQCYILNKNHKLLPQNIPGELYIGGDGVSNGYLKRDDLNEEKFIKSPFIINKKIYNTNDLAYYTENGEIVHLGRTDFQVKIRGFRIELGEIENAIEKNENINQAVVIKKKLQNGNDSLIAFYTVQDSNLEFIDNLKDNLNKQLPQYMIPQYFVKIEKMPHTPNGKIDRKVLQNYNIKDDFSKIKYRAPRNKTEELLIEVIKKKLKLSQFGIDNNIFDFGADSLTIINIITELFGYEHKLKVIDFYKYPTVREIFESVLKKEKLISEEIDSSKLKKLNQKVKNFSKDINCKTIDKKYNVLLTGATGFFGNHLLIEMLNNTHKIRKIYCPIRSKKNISAKQRLINKVDFYFGDKYNELIKKYVEVIECEISEEKFGLNVEQYNELKNNIDIVVHSAANVKHYGDFREFYKDNVITTQNLIDFSKNSEVSLHYISTMTVSGNYLVKQKITDGLFDENAFYIGQNFEDNVYSKSKMIAESIIIKNLEEGLNGAIYRLGDLMGRYSDGVFQENINENATYLRLKSILEIGAVPEDIIEKKLEFSPVDEIAKAVSTIIWSDNCLNRIFNVYNPNMITTFQLLRIIDKIDYSVKSISKETFIRLIEEISRDEIKQIKLHGIINDFTDNKDLVYNYTIKQQNEITTQYLKSLGFVWNDIDEEYIHKIVKYMQNVKFIE